MDVLFDNLFKNIKEIIIPNPVWADAWSGRSVISSSVISDVPNCNDCLVNVKTGEQVKCFSTNGRKMVFIGTRYGAFLIYQHYPDKSEKLRVAADVKVWDDLYEYNQQRCVDSVRKPSLKYFLSRDDLVGIILYTAIDILETT